MTADDITKAANAVAQKLEAMVFVYSGEIDDSGFGHLIKAIEPSDDQPPRPNTVMLLTTSGGLASQAYRIARLIQEITHQKFFLCLPAECKSAGTLIALGASELYMWAISELGPLDVQLRQPDEIGQRRSGMVVRTALLGLRRETFEFYQDVMLAITKASDRNIRFDAASR